MKSIYTYYKERLIEISGKNRSLYLRSFNKKNGFDIGKILSADAEKTEEFLDILMSGKSVPFKIIGKGIQTRLFPMKKKSKNMTGKKESLRKRPLSRKGKI